MGVTTILRVSPEGPASQKEKFSSSEEPLAEEGHRANSLLALISDMASNTGMQGLPNIRRAQSIARRLFWFIIFLTGVGLYASP